MAGLFAFLKSRPCQASVPERTRVYAIGDIHGRADLLSDLHDLIGVDLAKHAERRNVVVYIGDYVDRGMQSKEVIDLILADRLRNVETVCLKGNHEALMLDFLADSRNFATWLENGGKATLYSYGVRIDDRLPPKERMESVREQLTRNLPPTHLEFLRSLQLSYVEGDYLFVHAGIRPRQPLDRQSENEILWIRDEFLSSSTDHGKVVVHGHSVASAPDVRSNRIGIDTGAFASGVLTCLILDGQNREFLQTGGGNN